MSLGSDNKVLQANSLSPITSRLTNSMSPAGSVPINGMAPAAAVSANDMCPCTIGPTKVQDLKNSLPANGTTPSTCLPEVKPVATNQQRLTFYRRILPEPPAIAFAKPEGRRLFAEALSEGTAECFFPLIEQFCTQDEPAFCGLGALTMVLNALAIDPKRIWKGGWRWFHDRMLDCCLPVHVVEKQGLVFHQLVCLARCNGAMVKAHLADDNSSEDQFRQDVIEACEGGDQAGFLLAGYSRQEFHQTGDGHYSPIGAYHRASDSVLILDVARFKYPPHWVPLTKLWKSMKRLDPDTKSPRGYMILKKEEARSSLFFTFSRERLGCCSTLYGTDKGVQEACEAAYAETAQDEKVDESQLLAGLLKRLPPCLSKMLSTYPREYNLRRQESPHDYEDAVASLMRQLCSVPIYPAVLKAVQAGDVGLPPVEPPDYLVDFQEDEQALQGDQWSAAYHVALLLSIPQAYWEHLRDGAVRETVLKMFDVTHLPGLNVEVCHLRKQLAELVAFDVALEPCSLSCAHSREECSHHTPLAKL